jgi:hypothetical protein
VRDRDLVAVVLAVGLSVVVTLFTLAAVIDAMNKHTELSDNSTQVLLASIGGMIGALGGYLAGRRRPGDDDHDTPDQ